MDEVADWCECHVLATCTEFKRGDLKSAISQEDIAAPDLLEEQVWNELVERSKLFSDDWLLELDGMRLRLNRPEGDVTDIYRYLCLLGLGQAESDDRVLFEELVAHIVSGRLGPRTIRVGHPASSGMDPSFRVRIREYVTSASLSKFEVNAEPYSHDKDLGLDVVSWIPSRDSRGGYLHFLLQCATGRNWDTKLDDINLEEWKSHLTWAVPPVRVFCVPNVVRVPEEKWIRLTRRAGWILDRPRLVELADGIELDGGLKDQLSTRVAELSAA